MRHETYRERRLSAQDGVGLYYRDYPGPAENGKVAVLCLGGLSRNSKDFHQLAQHLSDQRRVICPDYRGRGRSDAATDWRTYHPVQYLDDLRHLLTVAGLHRFVAIGTSLGGLLAMGLAASQPTALAGAILNDIGPEFEGGSLDKIVDYVGRDVPQPDLAAATRFLKESFTEIAFRDEETWRRFAEGSYRQGDDGQFHVDWDTAIVKPLVRTAGELPDLWHLFAGLRRIPVLVVRGETSNILSAATLNRMEAEHPGLASVTVAGLGHAPSLDEPEAQEAIDDFFAALDARRDAPSNTRGDTGVSTA
ncbi:MAG: alpha/beta fold hydrolase [Kiloniellales bacterium]